MIGVFTTSIFCCGFLGSEGKKEIQTGKSVVFLTVIVDTTSSGLGPSAAMAGRFENTKNSDNESSRKILLDFFVNIFLRGLSCFGSVHFYNFSTVIITSYLTFQGCFFSDSFKRRPSRLFEYLGVTLSLTT